MNEASFTVGLIQDAVGQSDQDTLEQALDSIRVIAKKGAQIVCLQEIFSSRYFCTVENSELFDLAQAVDGPLVSKMSKLAAELEIVLVVPFFERRAPGVYHNSAAVIDADGCILGVYRKMNIPDDPLYYEKYYFTPGDQPGFEVFQTRYAKIGVLICWDQWYPEAARIASLKGAEVLFYPTAIGWHPAEKESEGKAQLQAWQTIQRSHSIANGVFVASVNRVGFEPTEGTDGLEFFGSSFVTDPIGRVLAQASESVPEQLVVECRRRLIEETRRNWPFLRDRRVDAYGPITSRFLDVPAEK